MISVRCLKPWIGDMTPERRASAIMAEPRRQFCDLTEAIADAEERAAARGRLEVLEAVEKLLAEMDKRT